MAKAKVTKNGKHEDTAGLIKITEMEEYLISAKDILDIHDDQLEKIESSLKALHTKVDRAMSRLGIS